MLQSDALDYVALGHVHSHQVVPGKITMVYLGSLERIDFSETPDLLFGEEVLGRQSPSALLARPDPSHLVWAIVFAVAYPLVELRSNGYSSVARSLLPKYQ